MNFNIVTDSTSDITQLDAREKNIQVVPLRILFEDGEYHDGINISTEEFYNKLESAKVLPQTSQPSPEDFFKIFEKAKKNDEAVLVITLSSSLSGTYQSATIAKNICEYEKIYIVDSQTVTLGLKVLVDYAISLRNDGKSIEETFEILEREKQNIRIFAAVDTLEYLKKGGRLSSAAALAGTLLNLKPIVKVQDGAVSMAAKARGTNNSYSKIKALIEEAGGIDEARPYTLGYTGSSSNLNQFATFIDKTYNLKNCPISAIGSTVGVHAGPGACGIAFFIKTTN